MKQKNVWLAMSIIFAVAVIIGGLYFATDLFKSPEQLFYKNFAESSKLLGTANYEEAMKKLQKQNEASLEVAGEITAKVTTNEAEAKEVADVLNKGKITYNVKMIGSEQKSQSDITLNYNQKDIVTLNLKRNKDQYGIKIAEAYDKYISVENNNLKALFQKLGIDASKMPNKIETLDYKDFLKIDKEVLKHIETTYSDIIKQNIPSKCYTIEKNATTSIDGNDVSTNAYKLVLTEEQVKNVLVKVMETLKTDDITLNLLISKVNQLMEPYKMMGMEMTGTELTKENLVKALTEELEELNKQTVSQKEAVEITVYAAKNGIAKIEISVTGKDNQKIKFELDTINTNETKKVILKVSDEETKVECTISSKGNTVNLLFAIESDGTKVDVNVTEEIKATQNVTVEDFKPENSIKLNDMTQAEINSLAQTIYMNAMSVLPQKMQLLGISTTGPTLPSM